MMALRSRPAPALVLLAVSFTALVLLFVLADVKMPDAFVYRAEGAAVAHGRDLYGFEVTEGRLPATYPPFAALLAYGLRARTLSRQGRPVPPLRIASFALGIALVLAGLTTAFLACGVDRQLLDGIGRHLTPPSSPARVGRPSAVEAPAPRPRPLPRP